MPLRRAKPLASCATPLASCAKPLASCAAALVLAVSLSGCSDEGVCEEHPGQDQVEEEALGVCLGLGQ